MINGLKPYSAMEDSGVRWLGEVPEHWEVAPAFAVYRPRQVKNTGLVESTVLSLSYGRIIVKAPEKLRGLVPESFETYQIVEPGNIIVRTTDLQNDRTSLRIGHARHRGIITAAYMCLETKPIVMNEFGYQYLNAYDLLKIIYGFGSGLRQNLDFSDIKRMPVLVPPRDEQAAIVRYLEYADRRIRRYIRAKQKLIKLLEEQKQAIIHRAVTRGLDPNVRLKPSGVEWLGDVPEHWQVVGLRYLATKFGSGVTPRGGAQVYQAEGVPFLRSQNVHFGGLRIDAVARISRVLHEQMAATHVRPSDVLLNITGASIGRACAVPENFEEGNVNQHVCIIRPLRSRIDPRYLAAFLSTPEIQTQIYLSQNGSSREGLTLRDIHGLPVLVPPLEEQRTIIHWAGGATAGIDGTITRTGHETDLLREYRTRLIADVVTGKLDVRDAATRLPREAEDLEPLDEAEVEGEAQEADAGDADDASVEVEA